MTLEPLDFQKQVAAAFVERYIVASQEIARLLDRFDEEAYREYIALTTPKASKYLQARTREEMSKKSSTHAIAVSVAAAISEAVKVIAEGTNIHDK